VFALGGVLGALHGPVPGAGLTAVVQDLVLLVLCACIASVAQSGAARLLLVRVWAVSGLCWGVLLIAAYLTHIAALAGGGGRYGARATLTMGDPNIAGNYLMVSLLMLYVARWPTGRYWRTLATLVMVGAIFLTGSNGALTAALIGAAVAAVVAFCTTRQLRTGIGLLALVGLVVVVLAAVPVGRWQNQVTAAADASSVPIVRDSIGRQDQSSSTRHLLLDESIQLFRSDAVVGTGPGSTKPLLEANQAEYAKEAHDDYAAALVERGMLGLVGLLLLIGATVRRLGALARRWVAGGHMLLPLGPMAGVAAALATSGMFYEVLHFRQVWVFLGLLAGTVGGRRG
jgi:O-antigen ligase